MHCGRSKSQALHYCPHATENQEPLERWHATIYTVCKQYLHTIKGVQAVENSDPLESLSSFVKVNLIDLQIRFPLKRKTHKTSKKDLLGHFY